jgi:hypothetical protein
MKFGLVRSNSFSVFKVTAGKMGALDDVIFRFYSFEGLLLINNKVQTIERRALLWQRCTGLCRYSVAHICGRMGATSWVEGTVSGTQRWDYFSSRLLIGCQSGLGG